MTQLGTGGVGSTNLYFIKRLSNTTFSLYKDSTLSTTVNTGVFFPATAGTGYALGTISPTGNAVPGGSNTQVQYNDTSGVFGGSSTFTFNKATNLLNVGGNINASNVNANVYGKVNGSIGNDTPNLGTFTSVIALNNANITANVNSGNINVSGKILVVGNVDAGNINATTLASDEVTATGNMTADYFIGNFIVGNIIGNVSAPGSNTQVIFNDQGNAGASSNFTFNTSTNILTVTGNITSTYYTGTLKTGAQPNITSVGTLTSVTVTGNVSSGNANLGNLVTSNYFTGNGIFISNIAGANVSGTVANATYATSAGTAGSTTTAGTVTTNAQPNITSVGTLSSLTVTANISSGNANLGNLATASYFSGNGIFISKIAGANVSGNVTSAVQSHYANIANSVAGANVSGQVGNALVAGTIYTNAQPNITSVGTLVSLTTTGEMSVGGNVIPNANVTYDLGNATNRFKDLWLSGTTIHLGGISITTDSGGNISLGNITFSSNGTIDSSDVTTSVIEFADPYSRKLALTDNNNVILGHANSTRRLVIPDEANINFPIGSKVEIINDSLYGNTLKVECESNVVVKLSVIDNTGALINYTALPAPDPEEWVKAEIYPAGTISLTKIYSDTWYMTGMNANITYPLSPATPWP